MLAILVGCGLRRGEQLILRLNSIQLRESWSAMGYVPCAATRTESRQGPRSAAAGVASRQALHLWRRASRMPRYCGHAGTRKSAPSTHDYLNNRTCPQESQTETEIKMGMPATLRATLGSPTTFRGKDTAL